MARCVGCNASISGAVTKKWCSETCRKRVERARDRAPSDPDVTPAQDATRAALEVAGRLDTWQGQAALALAKRIDSGASTMAADVKQLQVTMAAALQGVKTGPVSALDELRARRDAKRGVG